MANDRMSMSADERARLSDALVLLRGEVRILISLLVPELEPGVEWESTAPHLRLLDDPGVNA